MRLTDTEWRVLQFLAQQTKWVAPATLNTALNSGDAAVIPSLLHSGLVESPSPERVRITPAGQVVAEAEREAPQSS